MKPSPTMQRVITQIAQTHALDLEESEAHLRLVMPHFDRLVIEKIGRYLVSVAHYFEQNGDLIADTDVVFFTGYREWIPIEITQSFLGTQRVAQLDAVGVDIVALGEKEQRELALFTEEWARNIKAQGWVDHAAKA